MIFNFINDAWNKDTVYKMKATLFSPEADLFTEHSVSAYPSKYFCNSVYPDISIYN